MYIVINRWCEFELYIGIANVFENIKLEFKVLKLM